jgi:hypothetical protein
MYFYDGKVSCIDGASVTIILCLHVLIAHRILFVVAMLIIFSEYRCYNINNRVHNCIWLFFYLASMCTPAHVLMRLSHRFDRSFAYKVNEGRHIRIKYIYYRLHEWSIYLEIYHRTVLVFNNYDNNNNNDNSNNNKRRLLLN